MCLWNSYIFLPPSLPPPLQLTTVVMRLQPELVVVDSSQEGSLLQNFILTYALSFAPELLLQDQAIADVAVELPFQSSDVSL